MRFFLTQNNGGNNLPQLATSTRNINKALYSATKTADDILGMLWNAFKRFVLTVNK